MNRPNILNIIKNACKSGKLIVITSQVTKGGLFGKQELNKVLGNCGLIYIGDMTLQCTVAKLSYLIGKVIKIINKRVMITKQSKN